jgi:AbrB family looped-hinge helix DNA binding protein
MSGMIGVEMGDRGRIVIPASIRERLHLKPGSRLNVCVENGSLILMTPEAAEQELFEMFAGVPVSLADELVADRRAEEERENGE